MALLHYDYECESCGHITDDFRAYENRHTPIPCACGGSMEYLFPVGATFQPCLEYHDPALGIDIRGRRERQQAMRHFGVIEAGDPVNGKRNIETSEYAHRLGPEPLQGIRLSDIQRRQELGRKAKENFRIGVVERDSKRTITEMKSVMDLPSAMKSKKKVRLGI